MGGKREGCLQVPRHAWSARHCATTAADLAMSCRGQRRVHTQPLPATLQCAAPFLSCFSSPSPFFLQATFKQSRGLLKLYQLYPESCKFDTVLLVLLKALTALPEPEFTLCMYLLPEAQQKTAEVQALLGLEQALQKAEFERFWVLVKEPATKALTDRLPSFLPATRRFIAATFNRTYQRVSAAVLKAALGVVSMVTAQCVLAGRKGGSGVGLCAVWCPHATLPIPLRQQPAKGTHPCLCRLQSTTTPWTAPPWPLLCEALGATARCCHSSSLVICPLIPLPSPSPPECRMTWLQQQESLALAWRRSRQSSLACPTTQGAPRRAGRRTSSTATCCKWSLLLAPRAASEQQEQEGKERERETEG